ncbi:MAG: ABC transporter permease [Acidobacteriaceae bacterium]|nr:ABC transporter permease [Acidobacteriaceae bacterium]
MQAELAVNGLAQDLRFAFHQLRSSPGFTFAAILTLALGIGCNAGVFSFVYAWLLSPSPFPHSERITLIRFEHRLDRWADDLSRADFDDLQRATSSTFEGVAAFELMGFNVSGAGTTPERIPGARVSPDFLAVLRAQPEKGRGFLPEDARDDEHSRVALISHGIWKQRFGGSSAIIGKEIRLEGSEYRVIGVMPAGFHVPVMGPLGVWVPLAVNPREEQDRANRMVGVLARLRSGVTAGRRERGWTPSRTISLAVSRPLTPILVSGFSLIRRRLRARAVKTGCLCSRAWLTVCF